MSASAAVIRQAVVALGDPERAASSAWFFKTGPGEYGEGDVFAGVPVPQLRKLARQFRGADIATCSELVADDVHEVRLLALLLMVQGFAERAQNPAERAQESAERALPPLTIEATPTFVVSTALATRDFQDVHHDRDLAQQRGSKDIFVNILTDTGLVERFVTDWAGPAARVGSIALKLGVPWYAYDTLTFTGEVTNVDGDRTTVAVTGTNSLGRHVISTVTVTGAASEGNDR